MLEGFNQASDESKFISGAELWIDGGQIASY
jgi:hypothetical protein